MFPAETEPPKESVVVANPTPRGTGAELSAPPPRTADFEVPGVDSLRATYAVEEAAMLEERLAFFKASADKPFGPTAEEFAAFEQSQRTRAERLRQVRERLEAALESHRKAVAKARADVASEPER